MLASGRKLFPYIAVALLIGSAVWAVSFGTLEPAAFTFINETEIQSIDPAKVTGVPEGRILRAIFEGLYRNHPVTNAPEPALAESCDISADGKVYTFHLRKGAVWSDDSKEHPSPITARDFHWSWQRFLHPETGSQYAYQLWYVKHAKKYTTAEVEIGDPVEVELNLPADRGGRRDVVQMYPSGPIVRGNVTKIDRPEKPAFADDVRKEDREKAIAKWKDRWVYTVNVDGRPRRFSKDPEAENSETCHHVLLDFSEVGIQVIDDYTLQVTLDDPTPFFLDLMCFYPMYPVNRACIEKYGEPDWTKPGKVVTSGPFMILFRRLRDRIRMVKNPKYWDKDNVHLNVIDALAVDSDTTSLNMYLNGEAAWQQPVPLSVIEDVKERPDHRPNEHFATYFYRLNTTRKPLDNKLVRQALNLALDKQMICDSLLRKGEKPARSLVPAIMTEHVPYQLAECAGVDVAKARQLLAAAGYPDGQGIPRLEILFNTNENHRLLAEVIQQQWKKNLGINVTLTNTEWGVYLDRVRKIDYQIARAGWNADYRDPNTFLDMFVTGGENNETGWSNARYDELINVLAKKETDQAKRMAYLHEAEAILMDELPIIPIYFYIRSHMVRPYVKGWYLTPLDIHPLKAIYLDESKSSADPQRVAGGSR